MTKLENLRSDSQFKKLLREKKIHTDYFSVYFAKNFDKKNNKKLNISFIMKKKEGNAVMRNKIKRKLRSAIQRKLKNTKLINTDYSYIVFGKSKTFAEKYSIISNELDKTFLKINKMKN